MAREAMEVVEAAKGEAGESEGGVWGVIGRAASGQGGEGGGDGFADLARLFSNPIMSNAYAAQMLVKAFHSTIGHELFHPIFNHWPLFAKPWCFLQPLV